MPLIAYKRLESVTIAAAATNSSAARIDGVDLVGLYMPAAFTGSNISFKTKHESGDTPVVVTGVSMAVTAGTYMPLPVATQELLSGCKWIVLVSDGSEAAAREIKLALRARY